MQGDASQPDVAVIEHAPVPRWGWGGAPPFVPFPWDDPAAAERGRARHAGQTDPTPGGPDQSSTSPAHEHGGHPSAGTTH